jgi:hypothetical protein
VVQVVVPFKQMVHERMCRALGGLVATERLSFYDPMSERRLDRARLARSGDKPQAVEFVAGKRYEPEKVAEVLSEFDLKFEVVDFGEGMSAPVQEEATAPTS